MNQKAANQFIDLQTVKRIELVDQYLWDNNYIGPIDAESQLFVEVMRTFGVFAHLWEQIEEESADAFQETTVFSAQNIQEELVHLRKLVLLALVLLVFRHSLEQSTQTEQSQWCCPHLAIEVGDGLIHEEELPQWTQQIQVSYGFEQFIEDKERELEGE